MSQLSDFDQDFKNLAGKIDRYLKWTVDSAWKRVFTLIAFGALILSVQSIYLNHLITKINENTEEYLEESKLLEKEIRYDLAMDWLDICLKNRSLNSDNSIWYCKDAVENYENSTETNNEYKEKIVKNLAYDLMLIDLKNHKRRIEVEKLRLKYISPEYEILKLLLSKTIITLFIALFLLSVLGLLLSMYKYREKHNRNV